MLYYNMGCCRCSTSCKKWTTFGVAAAFVIFGLFFSIFWAMIVKKILSYELGLSSTKTNAYGMWKETPIPIYLSFYFFNWTNAEEYQRNSSIKPNFVELGPYTYHEHHVRDNVTINDNSTISFYNRRTWTFVPDKSVGKLTDQITTFNPVVASIASLVKDKNYIVLIGVDFFLEEYKINLTVTKTVEEFTFEGYEDDLLNLVQKLNITGLNIPFKKFGWFVDRNDSAPYDGMWNMDNGANSIDTLGLVRNWNYQSHVPYYEGTCGDVEGTQGELWYPPHDQKSVKIFSNDLCSSIELDWNGDYTLHGMKGHKFVGNDKTFDNGTKYPQMGCFKGKGVTHQLSGVRNVSLCKYGAPAFVSFPHFYEADPAFLADVDGLKPNKEKHEMFLALEPETGLPLSVRAQIQLNLKMEKVKHIKILENVKSTVMPMFWFSQQADLTSDLADSVKGVLLLAPIGAYTGYGLLGIGVLITIIGLVITYRKGWHDTNRINDKG
ncbi:protein croquemort isoform X2 [Diabrotica undecimpunctata]|uniref:protein croquemort isoform X2 n=1 Tax=Diabrotica undecimpunctata TaxID=50387 RepID=UPI003B63DBE4